ncbi:MAG: hypothetical protein ACTJHU_00260 [Mycetocola sp.]
MDIGQLAWDTTGLYFSDMHTDYHLNTTLTSTPSEKTDYQQGMFSFNNGTSFGLYNDGFTDDTYIYQGVASDGETSPLTELEGMYPVTGNCDGEIYGVGQPTGKYAAEATERGLTLEGESGYTTEMLAKLSNTPNGTEQVLDIRPVTDSSPSAVDTPCVDGVLHYVASVYTESEDGSDLALRSWDTTRHSFTETPLTDSSGQAMTEYFDKDIFHEGATKESLRNGRIDWVGLDSTVYGTDVSSGKTVELYTVPGEFDFDVASRSIVFTDDLLVTATEQNDDDSVTIVAQDRETGDVISTVNVPAATDIIRDGLILRDLAVAPK